MNIRRKRIQTNSQNNKTTKIILAIICFVFLFCGYKYFSFPSAKLIEKDQKIHIDKQDRFATLWKKIPELDSIWYSLYLKMNKPNFQLQAGTFQLKKGDTVKNIFSDLQKPITDSKNITILEWWNIFDTDEKLTTMGLIQKWEYIAYVTNPEKIEALRKFYPFLENIKLESLEWYLYPDTYKVNPNEFGINILVIAQLDAFENQVYKKILSNKNSKEIYELLNLASIVEKEEKNSKNKPTVAGILKKRLDANWRIGADATVCYPYKLTSQNCKMVVSKYIYEKNDYNTRTKTWLPKTPIANPNFETVNATLNYKKTPYWFYLHNVSTGKIYFAETNAQHEENKRNYIR